MKSAAIAILMLTMLAPAKADELTPNKTQDIRFELDNPFVPSPPDTLVLELDDGSPARSNAQPATHETRESVHRLRSRMRSSPSEMNRDGKRCVAIA